MFCFTLWLSALVISQSQSTGESAVYRQTSKAAIHQQQWDGQGEHPSALPCWLTLQEPEQEATGRWRGLLSSHNPAIMFEWKQECSHPLGTEHVIWAPGRDGWSHLRRRLLGRSDHHLLWGGTSDLTVAEYQIMPPWMILCGLWASFQPLYLGQVALLQAFSIFKPQRHSLKLKSGLF